MSLLFLLSFPLHADENVSLQALINTARQNNPEIKSAEKTYQSADYGITSMSAWSNPLVGYEFMKDDNRLYISQMFSFPCKLSYKKTSASNMAKALNQQLKQKILELDTKIKKTFWGYWLAYMNIDKYNENIVLMKESLEMAKSRYIVGKVTEADVLSATAELGRMQGMLVIAQYEMDAMCAQLNALMNKSPDESLGTPEKFEISDFNIDYAQLEKKTLNDNFGLAEKKYMYQGSLADSKFSTMEWFPDLMAEARISDMPEKTTYMAAAQVPLYFWNRVSEVRSKNSQAEAVRQTLESEKNSVRLALKDMYLQYNRNMELIKIYESDILPSANQAVQIAQSAYRTGKVDFQYLLDLQKKNLDFEIEYNKLTAESRMYYAELEMIAGGDIK